MGVALKKIKELSDVNIKDFLSLDLKKEKREAQIATNINLPKGPSDGTRRSKKSVRPRSKRNR